MFNPFGQFCEVRNITENAVPEKGMGNYPDAFSSRLGHTALGYACQDEHLGVARLLCEATMIKQY